MRLAISIPSNRDHSPFFVASLVGMVQHLGKKGIEGRKMEWYSVNIKAGVSNLPNGRQELIDEAIKADATHLMFLDDDMTFPFNMLDFFCRWDVPVVGANCCRKSPHKLLYTAFDHDGVEVKSKGMTGLQEVSRVGTGVLLIDLSILKDIPKPHFEIAWSPERNICRGEDFYFCNKLREAGIKVYIDHDVSNNIGHLGAYNYTFESYAEA